MNTKTIGGLAALSTLVLAGCGGGGGIDNLSGLNNNTNTNAGGTVAKAPNVIAFATSTPNTKFSHAWATIYQVDLVNSAGSTRVFYDAAGRAVDLVTLKDAAGQKFDFLGKGTAASTTFTSAKVSMSKKTTLIAAGQTRGTQREFEKVLDDPKNPTRTLVTVPMDNGVAGTPVQKVVLDLNLRGWSILTNGTVHAAMKRGGTTGVEDPGRQITEDFKGLISALSGTAPDQRFNIGNLAVQTNADTNIANNNGAPNPALANGQKVEITGKLVNNVLLASSVKIEVEHAIEGEAEVKGTASNLDASEGTLTVTITDAKGFTPTATTIPVTSSSTTKFILGDAAVTQAEFFAALAAAPTTEIEAEGALNNGALAATILKAENENENENEGEDDGGHHGG